MNIKVRVFLDNLLVYDWNKLNEFKDMFEQSNEYKKILNQFENLIKLECQSNEFSFADVYNLLNSYGSRIQNIKFFGILKNRVNTHLLPGQLKTIIKNIEFEKYKLKTILEVCECDIRNKFELEPKREFLKKIGCNFDGYYDTYIYQCKNCKFEWMITVDDINGEGYYKIWDKNNFPINNKNCR